MPIRPGIQTSEVFSTLTLPLLFLRGGASGFIWVCAGISQYVASSWWTALPCGASVYGCRPGAPLKINGQAGKAKMTRRKLTINRDDFKDEETYKARRLLCE